MPAIIIAIVAVAAIVNKVRENLKKMNKKLREKKVVKCTRACMCKLSFQLPQSNKNFNDLERRKNQF
jgi:hypothetical protein